MNLHSPKFERTLRRAIKKAIRRSPELRRESRAAKKSQKHYSIAIIVRLLIALVPGLLIWSIQDSTSNRASVLAVVSVWGFGLIVIRAQALLSCLFASADLRIFLLLPIAERTIFQWEFQKFLRGSLMSLVHFLAGFSALALWMNFSTARWLAVPLLALLTWAVMLASTMLCAARWPRLPYRMLTSGFILLIFAIIVGKSYVIRPLIELLDHYSSGLNLLLPTGWTVSLFQLLVPNPHWIYFALLIPIAAVLLTLKDSLARLSAGYQYQERTIPPVSDIMPHSEIVEPPPQNAEREQPLRLGPTAIEEVIRSRQFLMGHPWHNSGWFENLLWRWLSEREKILSDFAFPNGFSISGPWETIFRNLGIAFLAALLAGLLSPAAKLWLLGIGLFITVCHALAQLLLTGRAFQMTMTSGVGIPMYAGLGIGFRELAALLVKCTLVQLPLLFSFTVVCSVMVIWQTPMPLQFGLLYGFKIGVLLIAGRFIALIYGFSSGTNDTSKIRLRTASLIILMIFFTLAFMALCAASLLVPDQRIALPLLALTLAEAYVTFRVYGWFYHANRFDLMRIPQQR